MYKMYIIFKSNFTSKCSNITSTEVMSEIYIYSLYLRDMMKNLGYRIKSENTSHLRL